MLEYVEQQRGKWHYGRELGEATQGKAERLIKEALQTEGVTEEHLGKVAQGPSLQDQVGCKIASRNDRHSELVGRAFKDGQPRSPRPPAVPACARSSPIHLLKSNAAWHMTLCLTDTFSTVTAPMFYRVVWTDPGLV